MEPGHLIFSLLSQAPTVTAVVGTRIFPLRAKQGVPRPYLTYQLISQQPDDSAVCDLGDEARVQVSLFADTYAELCTLSQAVRRVLHRYDGQGMYLEFDNQHDHHDDQAVCFFRSQDYLAEMEPDYVPSLPLPLPIAGRWAANYRLTY